MPHKNRFLYTRHETRKKAEARLRGNSRHTLHQINYWDPDVPPALEEKKPKKIKK